MQIVCSVCNKHLPCLPIFARQFNEHWGPEEVLILGYDKPEPLPPNFRFRSMGKEGDVSEWSTDLRRFFARGPEWVIWFLDDVFLTKVDKAAFHRLTLLVSPEIGKIHLTDEVRRHGYTEKGNGIIEALPTSRWRLSLQTAIWNKNYLLQYLTPGLDPWTYERQHPMNDGWRIIGPKVPAIEYVEAVRNEEPFKINWP